METWWMQGRDTNARGYLCPVCSGRESWNRCMMERRAKPERNDASDGVPGFLF